MSVELHHGDCLDVMRMLDANSVDTVITDPPAGIAFMGKKWDNKTGYVARTDKGLRFLECGELLGLEAWEAGFVAFMIDCLVEAYRVAKPGAMFLIWALPRTADLTGLAMRVAGIEVRDCVTHIFGSGFPKSASISKSIDKMARREYVSAAVNLGLELPDNSHWDWTKGEHSPSDKWWEKFKSRLSIDQWQSIERKVIGNNPRKAGWFAAQDGHNITAPATPAAKLWDGYGTALKPAVEFWLLGMKPLDGTFASNALTWDCAGLNIDGGRITTGESISNHSRSAQAAISKGKFGDSAAQETHQTTGQRLGRFPSNLILSHHPECVRVGVRKVKSHNSDNKETDKTRQGICYGEYAGRINGGYADENGLETIPAWECHEDCPVRMLDAQSGKGKASQTKQSDGRYLAKQYADAASGYYGSRNPENSYDDTGGASRFFLNLPGEARFFYQAKASKAERNLGLEGMEKRKRNATNFDGAGGVPERIGEDGKRTPKATPAPESNHHPTVKPLELMKYLCTLTKTPTGGVVLDLFMGSGTTGVACIHTGRSFVGIEREAEYFEIAQRRIEHAQNEIVQLALI